MNNNGIGISNRKRLEQDICGIAMMEPKSIDLMTLEVGDLFYDSTRTIYQAVREMHNDDQSIDAESVAVYLEERGKLEQADGASHLAQCVNGVPSVEENIIETREKQIKKDNQKRNLYMMAEDIQNKIDESIDNDEVIEYAISTLDEIQNQSDDGQIYSPSDLETKLNDLFEEIGKRMENPGNLPDHYLSTGIEELDQCTNGLGPGEFVVISGPAKAGKTTLANQILMQATLDESVVGYLESLEMGVSGVLEMWIHSAANVSRSRSLWGDLSQDEFNKLVRDGIGVLENNNMYLSVPSGATVYDFINRCRRVKRNHHADFAMLDYFQFLQNPNPDKYSQYEHLEIASHKLREAAKKLDLVIIVVSRLNRSGESYGTSAVEFDLTTSIKVDFDEQQGGQGRIISVPRVRSGPGGNIFCELDGERARFQHFEKER